MYDAAEIWRISHEGKEYIVLSFSAANPEKIDLQSNCHVGATTGVLCFCIDGFSKLKTFLGLISAFKRVVIHTDYEHLVRKSPSLHGRKSTPTPKFLDAAEAYFVCYIGPKFQVSLIYAFIGCS